MGMPRGSQVIHTTCVFRITVLVYSSSLIIFGKELFDFPIPLLCTDAKFKIFFGDGIPILQEGEPEVIWGKFDQPTLYTIMTASKLHIVAKKSPSR